MIPEPQLTYLLELLNALGPAADYIRGPDEAAHDREEAITHAADIIAILRAQLDPNQFREDFNEQFQADRTLRVQVERILNNYFREQASPGLLVYEEFIVADKPLDQATRVEIRKELELAHATVVRIFPHLSNQEEI